MKKIFWVVAVLLLLGGAYYYLSMQGVVPSVESVIDTTPQPPAFPEE